MRAPRVRFQTGQGCCRINCVCGDAAVAAPCGFPGGAGNGRCRNVCHNSGGAVDRRRADSGPSRGRFRTATARRGRKAFGSVGGCAGRGCGAELCGGWSEDHCEQPCRHAPSFSRRVAPEVVGLGPSPQQRRGGRSAGRRTVRRTGRASLRIRGRRPALRHGVDATPGPRFSFRAASVPPVPTPLPVSGAAP